MVDASQNGEYDPMLAFNNGILDLLPRFIVGYDQRLDISAVDGVVKDFIQQELGIKVDEAIANGNADGREQFNGGVTEGGVTLEFYRTSKEMIWLEVIFDGVRSLEKRVPSKVYLARTIDSGQPTYQ